MTATWPRLARTPEDIALAAQAACLLEVNAPKPGNVHGRADFADARFEDFLFSATAIGPAFVRVAQDSAGQIVSQAITATHKLVHTNTNLGIVLLLAPLAKAQQCSGGVRANLARVLAGLTVEDARLVYAAIRLASAGSLGRVTQADVEDVPAITLREAMALAQARDSIAREYVTDFAITFDLAYPALCQACEAAGESDQAIIQAFLMVLARVPDTLIARKRGREMAVQVSQQAAQILDLGGALTARGRQALADFDHALRDAHHTLNPGTTADLIAAALFLYLLRG